MNTLFTAICGMDRFGISLFSSFLNVKKKEILKFNLHLLLLTILILSACSSSEKEDEAHIASLKISLESDWGSVGDEIAILVPNLKQFDTNKVQVFFGETAAIVSSVDSELKVLVPESSGNKVYITVKIDSVISNAVAFNYILKSPRIDSIASNRAIPGNLITIYGNNFYTTGNKVLFNKTEGTVISENAKKIEAVIPQGVSATTSMVVTSGALSSNAVLFNFSIYSNPVYTRSLMADPTVIKAQDGYFYAYATETGGKVPIIKSKNLVDWEACGSVFNSGTYPTFNAGNVWAPDIHFFDGKYMLYFAMSEWGGTWDAGIGVATSDKPEGTFSKGEKMFISRDIDVENSIDPCFVEDNGKKYLFWGSFKGIYAIELSTDGLSVSAGAEKVRVAGTAFEGVYIHHRGDYYYLFASIGSCCDGIKSTYKTVVGRSLSLLGPYVDKKGNDMNNNAYEILIRGNGYFAGTGHNSGIVTDDEGSDWILFHAYDIKYPDEGRKLMLEKVTWVDGWPTINNGKNEPSVNAAKPYFQETK